MTLYQTYAHLGEFADFLSDNGGSRDYNPSWLVHLEGASRRVDGFCGRSRFGSGFGPRIGTNRYDWSDGNLYLDDDLISAGTVSVVASQGGGTTTLTASTDYVTVPINAPYRELRLAIGATTTWGAADYGTSVNGTWGYSNDTVSVGTLALASSSATAGTMTSGTAYAGQTLLIGSEQVYVSSAGTATGGTVLTLVRGVNGTTAAAGTAAASAYVYPREVVQATLQLAIRRWKGRDGGVTGDFGGGIIPVVQQRDTERSILTGTVGHLRVFGVG